MLPLNRETSDNMTADESPNKKS